MDERFTHLGPIEHSDETKIYMDVLGQCIGNGDIKNIAIAGPYAAGKSSVIKKYLNSNKPTLKKDGFVKGLIRKRLPWLLGSADQPTKILTIAIAAFNEGKYESHGGAEDLQLRILQQLLYTATGVDLPQSRFHRIKTRTRSLVVPTLLIMWALIAYVLYSNGSLLTQYEAWSLEFNIVFAMLWFFTALTIVGLEWVIHLLSTTTFSKISLKYLEFEKPKDNDTSLLNKYFDEILYFFDRHPYDLVIFEDLDRFNEPDIFEKLRELNTLLNQNAGIQRDIQFIYALRDSTFAVGDRTKFFDFIIPVVPVTGTANSEDLFLSRNSVLKRVYSDSVNKDKYHIEDNLLRDIAQFVTDPRTINNTFNEYIVYKTAIANRHLNNVHLFALVLYKNVFVKDFDELHYGKGMLYDVLTHSEKYRGEINANIDMEIQELEITLANAEHEHANSEDELLNIYVGHLYRKGGKYIGRSVAGHQLDNINNVAAFLNMFPNPSAKIGLLNVNGHHQSEMSLRELEESINPGRTLEQRLQATRHKDHVAVKQLREQLKDLQRRKQSIERSKLDELCEFDDTIVAYIDETFAVDGAAAMPWQYIALVKYLVRKGYLNENYHLYTTVFNNKEHWTVRDSELFLKIQSRRIIEHNVAADNAGELIRRLSETEFSSPYVFNISILDALLEHYPKGNKTKRFLRSIRQHYAREGVAFLSSYLTSGKHSNTLSMALLNEWPEYLKNVFDKSSLGLEAQWLVDTVDTNKLVALPGYNSLLDALKEHPEQYIQDDQAEDSSNALALITEYELNIPALETVNHLPIALSSIIEAARFELTLQNIHFALAYYDRDADGITKQTYQEVVNTKNTSLLKHVVEDINAYLEEVMFKNAENTEEPEEAIVAIVNHEKITEENRSRLIAQQSYVFSNLASIKQGHSLFFTHYKVAPSWRLLMEFYDSKDIEPETFIEYISQPSVVCALIDIEVDADIRDSDEYPDFEYFMINADTIVDDAYIQLIQHMVDERLSDWPIVSDGKKRNLVEKDLVQFNPTTYEAIVDNPELLADFICINPKEYLSIKDQVNTLGASTISKILSQSTDIQLLKAIAPHINEFEVDELKVTGNKLTSVYLMLEDKQLEKSFFEALIPLIKGNELIFNVFERLEHMLSDDEYLNVVIRMCKTLSKGQIKHVLSRHQVEKIRQLTEVSKRPHLPATQINKELLDMLKTKGILAEYSDEGDVYCVRKNRYW